MTLRGRFREVITMAEDSIERLRRLSEFDGIDSELHETLLDVLDELDCKLALTNSVLTLKIRACERSAFEKSEEEVGEAFENPRKISA